MQQNLKHQREFVFDNIVFSSEFESGNLLNVNPKENYVYQIWIQADPKSTYRTWFYFSLTGIPVGTIVTFCIMNMNNQAKLFKEGHLPVCKISQNSKWQRIKIPIQQNGFVKGEEGFQLTFKYAFNTKNKYYFAFSYPWTYSDNNSFIKQLIFENQSKYLCDYRTLCLSSQKRELKIFTISKFKNVHQIQMKQFQNIKDFQIYTTKNKKGIFISSRVHPGEVAASHILNGFLKFLFSKNHQAQRLLENFIFYIIPIVNPDGVVNGTFRCDSLGYNLNRFYTNPSPQLQPQIFAIKTFVIEMIKLKLIDFCLDLHAHVNKQGSFIYGNSTNILKDQVYVCLFPKLLQYNCRFFDYDSCNFSEKNMVSKDKGDDLSKEGASRVTFFKQTGLVSCWTLQCNYNSSKLTNEILKQQQDQGNSKSFSNGMILSLISPPKKQQIIFLNIEQFEQIGRSIGLTILDYYNLRKSSSYYNRLKNRSNLQLNLAISTLRMIPFHFDNECRKILNNINSNQCINQCLNKLLQKLNLDTINQYLCNKQLKSKSKSIDKNHKDIKVVSLKSMNHYISNKQMKQSQSKNQKIVGKSCSNQQKRQKVYTKVKDIVLNAKIPKIPKKK